MSHTDHDFASHAGVFVTRVSEPTITAHAETSHTEHGLTFLLDGWFRMEHGAPIEADAGTVTVVPAGVPHRPLAGENLEYWLVGFCASCVDLDESRLLMSPFRRVRRGTLPVVEIPARRRRRLERRFQDLREECGRGAPESAELVRSVLLLILGEVRRAMPGVASEAPAGTLVSEALEYIQRECLSPVSLKDVAAAVHRSPAHVAATVKAATGHSVGEWIAAGRVAEAASRLAHTDDSLDAIAEHVGWQDKTHFIRQFRKAYGETPAAWRRARRSAHRSL